MGFFSNLPLRWALFCCGCTTALAGCICIYDGYTKKVDTPPGVTSVSYCEVQIGMTRNEVETIFGESSIPLNDGTEIWRLADWEENGKLGKAVLILNPEGRVVDNRLGFGVGTVAVQFSGPLSRWAKALKCGIPEGERRSGLEIAEVGIFLPVGLQEDAVDVVGGADDEIDGGLSESVVAQTGSAI